MCVNNHFEPSLAEAARERSTRLFILSTAALSSPAFLTSFCNIEYVRCTRSSANETNQYSDAPDIICPTISRQPSRTIDSSFCFTASPIVLQWPQNQSVPSSITNLSKSFFCRNINSLEVEKAIV